MGKSHLKRITMPKSWPIAKKENVWITMPATGTHSFRKSMSINTVLKEIIKCADTTKEVKHILNDGKVKIDGILRKDYKFPVGLMDIISVEGLKKEYRLLIDTHGKFRLQELSKTETNIKPRKIIGKKQMKGGKSQVNLFDGKNLFVEKDYNVNDTLVFDTKTDKVKDHFKFEKGALIYIVDGNQVGELGILKEVLESEGSNQTKIVCTKGKEEFTTLKSYAFVIGKTKPVITLLK